MSSNGIHSNRPTFSTFPLWGKLFAEAGVSPLSNTGEKLALAQQALTNLRKAKLEQMVAIDDDREKAVLIAKFDHEMALVKEAIKTGHRDYPLLDTKMVLTDDGEKPILFRRPAHNEKAVTDWLNFTIHKSTFDSMKREKLQG